MKETKYDIINGKRICYKCGKEKLIEEFDKDKRCKGGYVRKCKECTKEYARLKTIEYIESSKCIDYNNYYKVCNRCNKQKLADDFFKDTNKKDGLATLCKDCKKKTAKRYYSNNREIILEQKKLYHQENREEILTKQKEYKNNNREKTLKKYKRENNKKVKFLTYANRLTVEEMPKEGENGLLLVKCAYNNCNNYFTPTRVQINNRITSLEGKQSPGGECRLYCSESCKENCDVFKTVIIPKSQRQNAKKARCNQARVREVLLDIQKDEEGYNYCEKCGNEFGQSDLYFHHNVPIADDHTEYDNAAHYMVVCEDCHTHEGCLNNINI